MASRVLACHSQSVSHTTDRVRDDRPDDAELAKEEGSHPAVQPVTCSSDRDDATLQPAAGRSSLSSVSAVVSGPLLPGDDGERPTLRSKQTGDGEQPARRAESMSSIDDRGVCVCLSAAVEAEGVRRMDSGDSDRHECVPHGRAWVVYRGRSGRRAQGGQRSTGLGRIERAGGPRRRENCDATEWKKWSARPTRRDRSRYEEPRAV